MSDETKEYNYCPSCGAQLPPDVKFCPDCGHQLDGVEDVLTGESYYGRLMVVSIFTAIFAILALISGISLLGSAYDLLIAIEDSTAWPDIVRQFADLGYTEAQVSNLLLSTFNLIGALYTVSGVAAAVGAFCGFMKKFWIVGLIGMIISTLSAAITIFGLIIGLVFIYLYVTCKPAFTN